MAYDLLLLERRDRLALLTLNRPERRNALNAALRNEISAALQELAADDGVSVAVITGAGPAFCGGFDTGEFASTPPVEVFAGASARRYHYLLQRFPKPLVAAVNGPAMGGGFDLAVLCDVRIVAETAVFGHPEIKFGAPTLFEPLAAIVGGGVARDLCLSGRRIDAGEAVRLGLAVRAVPADQVVEEAMAYAAEVAQAPAAALAGVKASIIQSLRWKFEAPANQV